MSPDSATARARASPLSPAKGSRTSDGAFATSPWSALPADRHSLTADSLAATR